LNYCEELARYSRIAEQKGLVNSLEGNLSLIDRNTGRIYITPSHKMKLLLTPEDICIIDEAGTQIGGCGKKSSEFFLHEAVYKTRSDANAVLHCHVPYLSAYAMKYQDFTAPDDVFLSVLFGHIICLPFGEHGTHEIHRGIEKALEKCYLALLGGHGVVCAGTDLPDAIGMLEAAENFAKTMFLASKL